MTKFSSRWNDCTSEVRELLHKIVSDSPAFLPTRLRFLICYRLVIFLLLFPFFIQFNFYLFFFLLFAFFLSRFVAIFHSFHRCFHPRLSVYPTNVPCYDIITSCDMRGGTINFRLTGSLRISASRYRISAHGEGIRTETGNTANHAE
jgi:hypothetical protein